MAVFAIICAAGSWQWNIISALVGSQAADILIVTLSLTATIIGLAVIIMERKMQTAKILGIVAMAIATPVWFFIACALFFKPGLFVSH